MEKKRRKTERDEGREIIKKHRQYLLYKQSLRRKRVIIKEKSLFLRVYLIIIIIVI